MRTSFQAHRGPSRLLLVIGVLLALPLLAAGAVASLYAAGLVDLPFLKRPPPSHEGMVAVPVSAREIPAYTKIVREHIYDPNAKQLTYVYLTPAEYRPEMIREFSKLFGRVLARNKPVGYVFTEKDFLPEGTREGVVAGIPPGKRAYVVEAERVKGLAHLRPGDHFDLVSSMTIDDKNNSGRSGNLIGAALVASPNGAFGKTKRAAVRPLVEDGVMVTGVETRTALNNAGATLTSGPRTTQKPIQEITIAVDPDEIAALAEALSLEAIVTCTPRSGRPGAEPESTHSRKNNEPQITVVETIVGGKREVQSFAGPAKPAEPKKADTTGSAADGGPQAP